MSVVRDRRVKLEPQTCPRRMGEMGPWEYKPLLDHWERGRWAATKEEADAEVAEFMARNPNGSMGNVLWCYPGEQPRTCSFCGGVHPEDAIALIRAGWTSGGTTKAYKRYLEPPGYAKWERDTFANVPVSEWGKTKPPYPSPIPPVKLYTMHFTPEQIAAFNAALTETLLAETAHGEAQT